MRSDFLKANNVRYEWHYIDVSPGRREQQITERNAEIQNGGNVSDFYLNEGLMKKLLSRFEEPDRAEMDFWHVNR